MSRTAGAAVVVVGGNVGARAMSARGSTERTRTDGSSRSPMERTSQTQRTMARVATRILMRHRPRRAGGRGGAVGRSIVAPSPGGARGEQAGGRVRREG